MLSKILTVLRVSLLRVVPTEGAWNHRWTLLSLCVQTWSGSESCYHTRTKAKISSDVSGPKIASEAISQHPKFKNFWIWLPRRYYSFKVDPLSFCIHANVCTQVLPKYLSAGTNFASAGPELCRSMEGNSKSKVHLVSTLVVAYIALFPGSQFSNKKREISPGTRLVT